MAVPTLDELTEAHDALVRLRGDRSRAPGCVRLRTGETVARLVVDNPGSRHALTVGMMADLASAVLRLRQWDGALVVLSASTPDAFCAGGHLGQVRGWLGTPEAGLVMSRSMSVVLDALLGLEAVSVACVEGPAVGGGAELALSTDLRFMGATAWMQWRQAKLGLVAGWGGAARLQARVGRATALQVLLGAERIGGAQALELGLADRVEAAPAEELEALVSDWSSRGTAVVRGVKAQLAAGVREEASAVFGGLWGGPVHVERMRSGRKT